MDTTTKFIFTFLIILTQAQGLGKNMPYQTGLEILFPKCEKEKENIFLTEDQTSSIQKRINRKLYSKMALRFKIKCEEEELKYAYIDSHIVRTLNETVIIVVNEDNKVEEFEISSFMEPSEYRPPQGWLKQLKNKRHDKKMRLNYEVDALSGATLSANAAVNATNKIVHLHKVLKKKKSSSNEKSL